MLWEGAACRMGERALGVGLSVLSGFDGAAARPPV